MKSVVNTGGGDQVYMTGSILYIAKTGRVWTPFDAKGTVPMTDALRITQVCLSYSASWPTSIARLLPKNG